MTNVWESDYIEVAYDNVLSYSSIYLEVRDFHINAMNGCVAVLDSGCGTGSVAVELLKRGAVVYAVDTSRTALEILQRKCGPYRERLHVYNTTAERLSFLEDETLDGVTSMFVVHFVDDFDSYLREHFRVLKKGGIFALTGRTRGTGEDMNIIADSYKDDLRKAGKLEEEGYRKAMGIMRERMVSVGQSVKHGYTAEQMIEILTQIGFVDIQEHPNPYFGQCYSLTSRKK